MDESGLIEVYHDGEWRSVCDDYWTDEDANVACRQLGFLGYGEFIPGSKKATIKRLENTPLQVLLQNAKETLNVEHQYCIGWMM